MTIRKLNNTNPRDLLTASRYATREEVLYTDASTLNPNEYPGYTVANMIPGLNDTDWEIIYADVNEAVQADPNPESVLLFEIPDYADAPHLAVIELGGYVPTSVRGYLIKVKG